MLLPDFPLEYWSIRVFEAIANSIGKFNFFDELSLHNHNKRLIWLLVELDLDRGLLDDIDITIRDVHFLQTINFWKDPFRFHVCWKTIHLKSSCPTSMDSPQCSDPTMIVYASLKLTKRVLSTTTPF